MANTTIYPYGTDGQLPSSIGIINDTTTGGADKALSAEQGKKIGKLLNAKDSDFYNVWVGTAQELEALDGDYQDDTLYIVGAVATIPTKYSVTKTGISEHVNVSGTNAESTQAIEGKPFSLTLSPASGYTINTVAVTMGSEDITSTAYNSSTGVVSIASVTGNITITATASIHITSITITADPQDGNSIGLHATVSPNNAENVTLAWSLPIGTTKFSISGSGANATLTLLSGATTSDSVVVTCADTNASSGTASGTLTVTPTADYSDSVPITEITDISATRTSANTLTLAAVADGNTPSPTFSLVGTVPTVKQVRRWSAGDEVDGETKADAGHDLIDVPAVVLSGNTLTYKDDCQVQVKATAGNVESDEVTISIVHDNADAIWFEDSAVKTILLNAGYGGSGEITYTQAAGSHPQSATQALFKNNTTIKRFKEWKWFTGSQFNVSGCSALESVKLPKLDVTSVFDSRFGITGTGLVSVAIPEGYTTYGASSGNFSAPPIQGKVTEIIFPSSLTTMVAKFDGLSEITEIDMTGSNVTNTVQGQFSGSSSALQKLATVKLPNTLTTVTQSRLFRECTALTRVEFGTGWTGSSTVLYYDGAFAEAIAMTYVFHSTTPPTAVNFASNQSGKRTVNKILVPRSAVDTYKGSSVFSSYVDKISAIEDEEA